MELAAQQAVGRGWSPRWITVALLLPLVPALFFVGALARAVRAMDELQQRICFESVFIAFLLTLSFSFVVEGLNRAGLYHSSGEGFGTTMMAMWAGAYVFTAWKYR